ncbi:MAG: hypothetical protein DRP42_04260 [Tenericutes bacterium]|nr:MAG: hypothetical protein DRP42_04260 [Mycoplasmatota bacterium]
MIEFKDPSPGKDGKASHVIADISSIIEEQIESEAAQKNADQRKMARLKVAIADEVAQKREIERDEEVGKRKQQQEKKVFDEEKLARESKLEVEKVQQVKTQEIEKARQIVEANQKKEVEAIQKQQKQLEGEGDRLMLEEKAKGEAAETREKLFAEAEGKEKLQAALNKFKPEAIRALTAELIVEKEKEVGLKTAEALSKADLNVFSGGPASKAGFDLASLLGSVRSAGDQTDLDSLLNRIARPNDLGVKIGTKELGKTDSIKDIKKKMEAKA